MRRQHEAVKCQVISSWREKSAEAKGVFVGGDAAKSFKIRSLSLETGLDLTSRVRWRGQWPRWRFAQR
jgi:hypothetical protein